MPVCITNRSRGLLILELNSAETVHLAPGEASPPLDDVLTTGNAQVEKLLGRGAIAVASDEPVKSPRRRAAKT